MFAGNGFREACPSGKTAKREGTGWLPWKTRSKWWRNTTPRSIVASKELPLPTMTTGTVEELNFQIAIQHKKNIEIISLMWYSFFHAVDDVVFHIFLSLEKNSFSCNCDLTAPKKPYKCKKKKKESWVLMHTGSTIFRKKIVPHSIYLLCMYLLN